MRIGFTPEKLALKLKPDVLQLLSALKPGQTVAAKVVSQDPGGQVLFEMLGSRIKADVGKPLKQGDQVIFEVVKDPGSKGVPSLKLLEIQPQAASLKAQTKVTTQEKNEPSVISRNSASGLLTMQNQGRETIVKAVLGKLPAFFEKMPLEKIQEGLQLPQTIPARVAKSIDASTVVFSVKGEEIKARVSSGIQEGRVVFLEKIKPGPSLEFRVIQPDIAQNVRNLAAAAQTEGGAGAFPKLIGMMSKLLQNVKPGGEGVRQLPEPRLEKLMQLIENISLKSDETKPAFLNNLIKDGGLSWENKLAESALNPENVQTPIETQHDIKGMILDLLSDTSSLSPEVGKTLESALASLENLQLMNKISTSEAGVFFLPFPIMFEGSFSFGQIFFDLPEESQAENSEKPFRVSLILNMTEIGKLKADVSFLKKKISGTVIVSSEETRDLFIENLPDLENNLLARGFESADFSVRIPRSSSELDSSSVFSSMVEKNDGFNILV
ncbi:flagellar hook-length control protein FliK [Desulforegula conservatrix]|uniref:flagellar hook-length control protein FliK n=1 Tax=Desulforegula conservatrix TaxID=153026 RepID=UPI0004176FCF|nr:flagellar hook-length control protein FliK [Desulforegula conservatrix]